MRPDSLIKQTIVIRPQVVTAVLVFSAQTLTLQTNMAKHLLEFCQTTQFFLLFFLNHSWKEHCVLPLRVECRLQNQIRWTATVI